MPYQISYLLSMTETKTKSQTRLEHLDSTSLYSPKIIQSLRDQTRAMQRQRGSGGNFPQRLDSSRISALPDQPSACRKQRWIRLECVHGHEVICPIRCGKCEGCRHHWRKKVRALVRDGCKGHVTWFVTLTFREYPSEIEGCVYDFTQRVWHDFLKRCDKAGFTFQYLRVVELQKRGTPHLHLVINRVKRYNQAVGETGTVKAIVGALAQKAGFGPIFHVERARLGGKGAASYMSKYLSKSDLFEMIRQDGRAIRRYSRSRGWCYFERRSVWRFRRVGHISREELYRPHPPCGCGDGQMLLPNVQAYKWVTRCIREDVWSAPVGLFDMLHIEKRD